MVREMKIEEVDPEGRFIRLRNTGDKWLHLSQYNLLHVDAKNPNRKIVFKFKPRNLLLPVGQSITVWSSGLGVVQNPPSTLEMNDGKVWPALTTADVMTTTLFYRNQMRQWMKFENGILTRVINHDDVKIVQRSPAV